jgi:hypothetical protein
MHIESVNEKANCLRGQDAKPLVLKEDGRVIELTPSPPSTLQEDLRGATAVIKIARALFLILFLGILLQPSYALSGMHD